MAVLEKILHGLKYYTFLALRILVGYIVEMLIDMDAGTSLWSLWAVFQGDFILVILGLVRTS